MKCPVCKEELYKSEGTLGYFIDTFYCNRWHIDHYYRINSLLEYVQIGQFAMEYCFSDEQSIIHSFKDSVMIIEIAIIDRRLTIKEFKEYIDNMVLI